MAWSGIPTIVVKGLGRTAVLVAVLFFPCGAPALESRDVHQLNRDIAGPQIAARDPTDGVIRFYQWKVSQDPDYYFNYNGLGAAYIQKARETGDITYYQLAEQALKKSLALESTHQQAIVATTRIATVYFAEHRFQDALIYGRRAIALHTGDLSPYAIIGDALLEMGDYGQAAAAYGKLQDSISSPYAGKRIEYLKQTRLASLAFLNGHPQESIREMRRAVATARAAQIAHENLAWTQFMLAEECLRVGNIKDAEESYQDALGSYTGYHLALAGLARLRTAQGRFSDAIELYQRALAVIPLPTYAAALGDVYRRIGRDDEAKKEYDLVEYIGKLSALNKSVFNRELALFYADHDYKLEQSLQLAQRELEVREDIYTWDVLAFALYKNGRSREAAKAEARANKLGTQDPLLFFHAAMIYRKLGETQRAKSYFESALALNPHFHIFYAESARRELQEINSRTARTGDPALVNAARAP